MNTQHPTPNTLGAGECNNKILILSPSVECTPQTEESIPVHRHCYETGVRESMQNFPAPLQWLLTWLTGKPLCHNELRLASILPPSIDVFLTPVLLLFSFAALFHLAENLSMFAFLTIPTLWLLVVGLLRKMQVTHLHHAIHNRLFSRTFLNKLYVIVVPSLLLIQNGNEYRREHLQHHNINFFTTRNDADASFLALLGFLPGRSRQELWINLWMTIFSPIFHFLFLRARLGSLLRSKFLILTISLVVLSMHATLVGIYGWKLYLLAVAFPMFFLYHISALLQFLTEHAWNVAGNSIKDWSEYTARCWGRFCGERYPKYQTNGGSILSARLKHMSLATLWALRMIFIHTPFRVSCLVSDLPAHDWHHLAHTVGQNAGDWRNSLYLRETAIANGDHIGFSKRELWGVKSMIDNQFLWLESIVCHYRLPNVNDNAGFDESTYVNQAQ